VEYIKFIYDESGPHEENEGQSSINLVSRAN